MYRLRLIALGIALAASDGAMAGRSDIVDFYTGNQLFDFCRGGTPACAGPISISGS